MPRPRGLKRSIARRTLSLRAPEGCRLGELLDGLGDAGALLREIGGDGAAEARVGDVVRRGRRDRAVAAGQLVLPLGASFHPREAARDREVDRLIVAELEVQERVVLDAAPV